MATATDTRPTRQYTCPHCGGMGEVEEDRIDYWPITRPCGYCEGRGSFTRPVLPRGAVRAFRVSWWQMHDVLTEGIGDEDGEAIILETSPGKAKMRVVREIATVNDWSISETLKRRNLAITVRRAPEHDPEGATDAR